MKLLVGGGGSRPSLLCERSRPGSGRQLVGRRRLELGDEVVRDGVALTSEATEETEEAIGEARRYLSRGNPPLGLGRILAGYREAQTGRLQCRSRQPGSAVQGAEQPGECARVASGGQHLPLPPAP